MSEYLPSSGREWEDWGDPEGESKYRHCMVSVGIPTRESVDLILAAPITDATGALDGRSGWRWFRFPDGTLVLGVFPQGDIYSATEEDHS
jgi:hypothetical protein